MKVPAASSDCKLVQLASSDSDDEANHEDAVAHEPLEGRPFLGFGLRV